MAWHRRLIAAKYTAKRHAQTERQKEMAIIRELCVKLAEENPDWGYGRIQGTLENLGHTVSDTTVGNILRAAGILPAPERAKQSNWKTFVRSHMDVMAVADFLNVEVWTLRGLVRFHVFFVMSLAKRQVHIAHIGCQTDGCVMEQVARNLTDAEDGILNGMKYFICDHDPLYTQTFRKTLKSSGIKIIQTRIGTPQQNGYAERFVKSMQTECLDHLIFLGEKSLRKAVENYVEHYHHERNHQGLNNLIPFPYSPAKPDKSSAIRKSERLGGLLNYYFRESQPENKQEVELSA
ncbi:transposase [Ruficoccus amylovorans]|uniref:Transposase n=1 Tax=Ruficoccus amylovorans TaxID=1804625 RepID=A0A842HCB2_9BACT|nr:integrase core domain-containing protein [Ruficoccus amylovorans]MBC2593829.1 transposase [Ruficoccus amylovorans]